MGALSVAQIVGLIIGLAIGGVIGGLLIILGSRLVMGRTATFISAFLAALVSAVVGYVIGLALGFAIASALPALAANLPILSLIAGFVVTGPVYAAIVKTSDGAKPSLVQAYIIYVIQLAIVFAVGYVLVTVLHIPMPGMPALGATA